MLIKIAALSLAISFTVFAIAAIVIQQTGVLIVDVQGKDGRFYVPVPMLLVNSALSLAPLTERFTVPREFEKHSDLVIAATDELLECPDGPFVEVTSPDDKILISKKGSNLIIDVKTDTEKVYVQIPIRATGKTLAKLATLESR